MSDFVVNAQLRSDFGTAASRRIRHEKKVPAVVYGTGKENAMLLLDHDEFKHQLEIEAFHNSVLKLKAGGKTEQVILREVQMHPHKPVVMHVDFQRISATDKLHMNVPLHFMGEEEAPGVKVEGGIVSHLMTELDISCLPGNLPEYVEVDVSGLSLNESIHLSQIALPEGVEFTHPPEGEGDHAVVSVVMPKVASDELEEGEEGEEGDVAELGAESEQDESGTDED
ncbi:MAG: 50S ribosomal protein L25/general stress protein Ctc [Proteobacteria bacterium]|nr:MAG: 50S ribosomal protein L25/general stress protein Ctc [Pseudomonadota bacterium]